MTETLTIVFGAGASYDSIARFPTTAEHPHRPPLTRQLFDVRLPFVLEARARYPNAVGLIEELRRTTETVPLEQELERITNEAREDSTLRREVAAFRFYLRYLLWKTTEEWERNAPGYTNYHRLLRAAGRWRERAAAKLIVVSFNYDLLADHAMSEAGGLNLNTISGYIDHRAIRLLKPHGSVNWVRESEVPAIGRLSVRELEQRLIQAAGRDDAEYGEDVRVVPSLDLLAEPRRSSRAYFPALTVPMQAKPFECPADHQAALHECVRDTTRVLVVGWRATEEHFLKLWRQRPHAADLAHIVMGSRERADEVASVLRRSGVIDRVDIRGVGFSQYVLEDGLTQLVNA